jgi:hypothetical protein
MTGSQVRRWLVLLSAVLSVVALAGPSTSTVDAAGAITAGPVLTGAACLAGTQGALMVTGEAFTPGGEVDLVLAEQGNDNPTVIRSVHASQSFFGPNGSLDPALGFQSGGLVGITLERGCAAQATIRAFDRQLAVWSNQMSLQMS